MNNLILVVFDSTRFDSMKVASRNNIDRLGPLQKRFSYASWTNPSHQVLVMGVMPHTSEKKVFASKIYAKEMMHWKARLDLPELRFSDFLPHMNLPQTLKKHGYLTRAFVSLPVLNPSTNLGGLFDSYELMPTHNDFKGMLKKVTFSRSRPTFHLLNVGETHFPYSVAGTKAMGLPRIPGLHGVLRDLGKNPVQGGTTLLGPSKFFTQRQLSVLKDRQIQAVSYLDELMGELYEKCPKNTWIIVTSDHGELFGESGYFGHGPIFHRKVFEVPFIEGMVPRVMDRAESHP